MIEVVYGCQGPCDADTQKYIDSIATCYVADGRVSSLVVNGGYFRSKEIWNF